MNGEPEIELTGKQALFIREYLKDFNGTQAAIRAGYSEDSARAIASENLTKPAIRTELKRLQEELLSSLGVNPMRVLQEYARLAFVDIRKLYDENGRLKSPKDIDDDTAAALCGLEVFEEFGFDKTGQKVHIGDTKKVKLYDKTKSLDALARHLALFNDKMDITSGGEPITGFAYLTPPKADEAGNNTKP